MSDLRVYVPGLDEFDREDYPLAWRTIKHDVRAAAGHRCERCGHPFRVGAGMGRWSPCDERCGHGGPIRHSADRNRPDELVLMQHVLGEDVDGTGTPPLLTGGALVASGCPVVEAEYRILTVHHLNGVKADCRWWNLAALCQRCHLTIQGRVQMARVWPWEHSDWFKPHAAGWYAAAYLDEDLTREEALARMDELLALERAA